MFSPGQQNASNWRELTGKEASSPRNTRGNTVPAWQLFDGKGERGGGGEFVFSHAGIPPPLLFQPSSTNGVKLNESQGLS